MKCEKCGKEIESGYFCTFCGTKLPRKNISKTLKKDKMTITQDNMINQEEKNGLNFNKTINYKVIVPSIIIILVIVFIIVILNKTDDIETIKDSAVMIEVYDEADNKISTGSGFCAFESNWIITNFHVIEGASKIKIVSDANQKYSIENIEFFSIKYDLAVLTGDFNLNPIKIGNINNLKAGEKITTISSPEGILNTVSNGIISNADDDYAIRITAPISPGSSGGVLLDKNNRAIGVTFATYSSETAQNINYAISIKYLTNLYNQNISKKISMISKDTVNNSKYRSMDAYSYNSGDTLIESVEKNTSTPYLTTLRKYCDISQILKNDYYKIDSINTFHSLTSEKEIFEYNLKKIDLDWYSLYNKMSKSKKKKVLDVYTALENYDISIKNVSKEIKNLNTSEFLLGLDILENYELAITLVDLENISSNKKIFKKVNSYSSCNVGKKMMIMMFVGKYPFNNFSTHDKRELVNYLGDKYFGKNLGSILKLIGYKVTYGKNDLVTAEWYD